MCRELTYAAAGNIGESVNGKPAVSKTATGGSSPSSPAKGNTLLSSPYSTTWCLNVNASRATGTTSLSSEERKGNTAAMCYLKRTVPIAKRCGYVPYESVKKPQLGAASQEERLLAARAIVVSKRIRVR